MSRPCPPERLVFLYVDDRHVGTLLTRRPLKACLRQLRGMHPRARSIEATIEQRPDAEPAARPGTACHCNACAAVRGEDPGR